MPALSLIFLWASCICAGHIVQAVTGFGAFAVALPILLLFLDAKLIVPILVGLNLLLCITVTCRTWDHIDWPLTRRILFLSLPGTPLGWLLFQYLPGAELKLFSGLLAVTFGLWNLWSLIRPSVILTLPRWIDYILLVFAGVSHGAYGTGGLVVSYYMTRHITHKTTFQATMSIIWALQNLMVCILYTIGGNWRTDMLPYFFIGVPIVAVSICFGMWLHHKINARLFLILVFGIMIFSGGLLIFQTAPALLR